MKAHVLFAALVLSGVLLVHLGLLRGDDPVIALDWRPRASKELRQKIDNAVIKYADELSKPDYDRNQGGTPKAANTLKALGVLAASQHLQSRLKEKPELKDKLNEYLKTARAAVDAERKVFWPNDGNDTTELATKLHGSASYHLPLVLLLLEHQQAGVLQMRATTEDLRDREMRFGILPAKLVRRDVVRLLALLLASKKDEFDAKMEPGQIWGYTTFGGGDSPCVSPTGMAAIGLSAAVFGLNFLEYETDDYKITFNKKPLEREVIRNRLVDVCTHVLFSLVEHNHSNDPNDFGNVKRDLSQLDADAFREVIAPGSSGETMVRLQAAKADLENNKHALSIYHYQANGERGAYYCACAAYALPTAARVLALVLERECNAGSPVGRQYRFTREPNGKKWRVLHDSVEWQVEIVDESQRRYCPLSFSNPGAVLPIDDTITGALNACVACVTISTGNERHLRGNNKNTPKAWMLGGSGGESNLDWFAGLHAFALYKAAMVTGDGYAIGRWPVWEDLANGLSLDGFVAAQVEAIKDSNKRQVDDVLKDRTASALAFSIMTLTRTYREIFPKSDPGSTR